MLDEILTRGLVKNITVIQYRMFSATRIGTLTINLQRRHAPHNCQTASKKANPAHQGEDLNAASAPQKEDFMTA